MSTDKPTLDELLSNALYNSGRIGTPDEVKKATKRYITEAIRRIIGTDDPEETLPFVPNEFNIRANKLRESQRSRASEFLGSALLGEDRSNIEL